MTAERRLDPGGELAREARLAKGSAGLGEPGGDEGTGQLRRAIDLVPVAGAELGARLFEPARAGMEVDQPEA